MWRDIYQWDAKTIYTLMLTFNFGQKKKRGKKAHFNFDECSQILRCLSCRKELLMGITSISKKKKEKKTTSTNSLPVVSFVFHFHSTLNHIAINKAFTMEQGTLTQRKIMWGVPVKTDWLLWTIIIKLAPKPKCDSRLLTPLCHWAAQVLIRWRRGHLIILVTQLCQWAPFSYAFPPQKKQEL